MTPTEKAKELVEKMFNPIDVGDEYTVRIFYSAAKQCALICCDEILNAFDDYLMKSHYWQQVKEEIQKL